MFNISTHYLVTLVFVILIIELTEAQLPSNEKSQAVKLAEYYRNKCYNRSHDLKIFDTLVADAYEFEKYLTYTFTSIPDNKKLFCETHRKQLEIRVKQFSNDLEPCLSKEEQYLPTFILDSFKGFTHFLCHNKGENIDRLFTHRAKICREALDAVNVNGVENCLARIFRPASGSISKKELCDDMGVAEKCFAYELDTKCPNYRAFKELNTIFFKNIRTPCSGCMYFNSLLLTLCTLFCLIYSR